MAMRAVVSRLSLTRSMESTRGATRYFSDDKGRVLSEEERAAENVYIQKMERERLEKLKQKAAKEKLEKDKQGSDKIDREMGTRRDGFTPSWDFVCVYYELFTEPGMKPMIRQSHTRAKSESDRHALEAIIENKCDWESDLIHGSGFQHPIPLQDRDF
ncbi:hypothetical protein Patl1_05870 [Pistacia atlantica]|uniref:Uncharacterized protein n=1 Tax=Pistacia atlantica TaxID=434234 RepID=A0ACC1BXH6_9ROSI|nr:hypothetical protein Patl1_05870 [Pistacia atlantica]